MSFEKWIKENTSSLTGKNVAITGSTGGLGNEICRLLASLGASLILVDRNPARSEKFKSELETRYNISVKCIPADLEDINSVKAAAAALLSENIDVFIHNAGAYSIPRHKCESGYDNVFQINFLSPYYIIRTILPELRKRGGRVVAVSSIAHNYSKIDVNDVDFATRRAASKVYGNAKRFLTYSLFKLFKGEEEATLAITHPGISFTGITAHYPKLIFALIKYPMKIIFMKPKKAALSVVKGVFEKTEAYEWFGPRLFDVWGLPKKKPLKTAKEAEITKIAEIAENIYREISEN